MTKSLFAATIFLAASLCACSHNKPQAAERPLPVQIKQIINQNHYSTAKWALYVKDLTTNQIVYRLNANKMLIPASVSKLFGVSALLHAYGSDYTFHTPVYAVGKTDNKGVFTGDLILVGKGDLTFGGRVTPEHKIAFTNFDHTYADVNCYKDSILTPQDPLAGIKSLATQIKAAGISAIHGNVLVDNRLFETITQRDSVLSPIMINDNLIDIEVTPTKTGKTADLQWRPQVSQMRVVNQIMTGNPGEKSTLNITTNGCGDQIIVSGMVPENGPKKFTIFPIKDPQKFAQNALIDALHAEGISLSSISKTSETFPDPKTYQTLNPLATWVSPPLIEMAKLIWKVSHNTGANLIPLLLASHEGKTTFEEGMRLIGNFVINQVHVNPNEISFLDGAGGNSNYVTCNSVIKMLDYIYRLPTPEFEKNLYALPTLGQDGTLSEVARQTPARGHIFAKTGTGIIPNMLEGNFFLTAQSLAGFIKAKNGHWLSCMIVVNDTRLKDICNIGHVSNDVGMIAAKIYEEG